MAEVEARVVGDYVLGPRIGSGSFAVVWLARHRQLGHELAVKEIEKKQVGGKVRDGILKEIAILRHISHPNIVHLYQAIQARPSLLRFFICLAHSNLFFVVYKKEIFRNYGLELCWSTVPGAISRLTSSVGTNGRVPENVVRHFMRQFAEGLKVLRDNNLIHRDLKPKNIMASDELQFPRDVLVSLHPDCINLCRSLLRQNPGWHSKDSSTTTSWLR